MKIKNLFFLAIAIATISITSCTIEEIETDIAGSIEGTYIMTSYETHNGTSTPSGDDKIVITRVDDTHVDVLVDYSSAFANDVNSTNTLVTKSGDAYFLERSYDNAEITGEVLESDLILMLEYTNGNFAEINASK